MILLALLAACATFTDYVDEGSACYADGQVTVTFPACATQSCDYVELEVTGSATMRRQGTACTEECLSVTASCDAPAGEATSLSYAGETSALDACTGD
jgi:hypothetical protein